MKVADSVSDPATAPDEASDGLLLLQCSFTHTAESAQQLPVSGFVARAAGAPPSAAQLALVSRFLHRNSCFLEVGATDCALSLAVANRVRSVYAVAHSSIVPESRRQPAHFHLILAEGAAIPVPQGSVDVAYSNGLIDRLSVEETAELFANVQRALTRGGVFVCFAENRLLTQDLAVARPHRCIGPPYTLGELRGLLRKVGFRRTVQYVRFAGANVPVRGALARIFESSGRTYPIQLVATN